MYIWILIAVLTLFFFFQSIASSVKKMVEKMSESPGAQERKDLAPEIMAAVPSDILLFLESKGFKFQGAYQWHTLRIGVWEQTAASPPQRLFSFHLSKMGATPEFITKFSDDASLTTSKTKAAFMFPRRYGSFLQSFPKASIAQLWDLHIRGEEHLLSVASIRVEECRLSWLASFPRSILRQMDCVKSIRLWPVRGIYWFFVKRFLMLNRPVWDQNLQRLYLRTAE